MTGSGLDFSGSNMAPLRIMNRRHWISSTLSAAVGTVVSSRAQAAGRDSTPFGLKFAPHEGHFKASAGPDIADQIRYAASLGFRAWEDNKMPTRPIEEQEKIGQALADSDMEMGVFVAYGSFDRPTFVVKRDDYKAEVLAALKDAIELAKRVNAKFFTVVPGSVDQQGPDADLWNKYGGPRLAEGYQTANAIELLRRCCELIEPTGLTMVLEPLNWHANHGGLFLRHADQAYALCKAVGSPACKILFDLYHMQIDGGNLIPNMDLCWDEIAYLQAGDNPGRLEPGTGEIHYGNVFKHLASKSRDFIIGMEHGTSLKGVEGEEALVRSYRAVDPI